MKIQAKCPRCLLSQDFALEKAGKRVRCAACRKIFKIPTVEVLSKALDIVESAAGTVYVDQDGNVYA